MNKIKMDRYVIIILLSIIALQLVPDNAYVFVWIIGFSYAFLFGLEIIKELFMIFGKKEDYKP